MSPLTISFGSRPDYLAGSENWRKGGERQPVLAAMREFDLDGTGPKMWEWLGADEGLLVFNPKGDAGMAITGRDLFGNVSFGKAWDHGFAPLATLDANKDGVLDGEELAALWVWRDKNSDAKVQDGEFVTAAAAGITAIPTGFGKDAKGGLISVDGVTVGGKKLPMRDWWSLGGSSKKEFLSFLEDTLATPSIYGWDPVAVEGQPTFAKNIEGGVFRFSPADPEKSEVRGIIGYTMSKDSVEPRVEGIEPDKDAPRAVVPVLAFFLRVFPPDMFGWNADMGEEILMSRCKIDAKNPDALMGMTGVLEKTPDPKDAHMGPQYAWAAKRITGPSLGLLMDAFVASSQLAQK